MTNLIKSDILIQMKNKIKILILLAIGIGTPVLSVYSPNYGFIAGVIALVVIFIYSVLYGPEIDNENIYCSPKYFWLKGNAFNTEDED